MSDFSVDIIIRAKNGHELTGKCVESIRRNTPAGSYRIILVDDGSLPRYGSSDSREDILISSRDSGGAVTATNFGLSISLQLPGDYVMVMDNDTEVPELDTGWLERFVRELEMYPGTAAVGATTNFASPPQHILTVPQTYTGDWSNEDGGGIRDNPEVPHFVSFCVLMRKVAVAQCGLWDTQYNPGNWEDTDYAVTLRANGFSVRVARTVYIHHRGHKTFREDFQRLLAENGKKFYAKWGVGRLMDMGIVSPDAMKEMLG